VVDVKFCSRCGSAMQDQGCPVCDRASSILTRQVASPAAAPATWRRPYGLVAVTLLSLAAAAVSLRTAARESSDVHRIQRTAERLAADVRSTKDQLAASSNGAAALAARVSSLEAAALDAKNHSVAKTAETVKKSVVTVLAGDAQGSGFAVSSAGGSSRVVTNFHVVADLWTNGVHDVKVSVGDATWPGQIIKVDEADDLALVAVSAEFPALPIHRAAPAVGDPVIAVGSPLGLEGSVSTGIVSALRHNARENLIQITAAINPGNSGGPLVDRDGAVVGVNEMKLVGTGVEGVAFAIPSSVLCADLPVCT
jgi:S1-C subfamily serine protease